MAFSHDLKDAGMVVPTTYPLYSPVCPVQKKSETWRMKVNNGKLNQVVTPTAAVVEYVISLVEQINTSGT